MMSPSTLYGSLLQKVADRHQWYKYDTWYWRTMMLFGTEDALVIMYDDLVNVMGVEDTYPEDMAFEEGACA